MTMMMNSRDQTFQPITPARASPYASYRTPGGGNGNGNGNGNGAGTPSDMMGRYSVAGESNGAGGGHGGAEDASSSEETVSSMVFSKLAPGAEYSEDDSYSLSGRQSIASTGGIHQGHESQASSNDSREPLTRVSSNSSLESSIEHGVRYKLTMKLSARDIMLIRESWSILLDDECQPEKLKSFLTKLHSGRTLGSSEATKKKPRRTIHQSMSGIGRMQPSIAEATSKLAGPSSQNNQYGSDRLRNGSNIKSSNSLFGDQFLENIIALAPVLETLFPMIKHIAVGVTGMLTIAVNNLEDLSVLDTYLGSLGKRHARIIGVQAEQFEFAGIAFIKTVRERFGVGCTHELEETWRRVYSFLANSLLQAGIDPVLENKAPTPVVRRREEQVVVMHAPELIVPDSETKNYGPKSELPPAPPKTGPKSLLDPLSFKENNRLSTAGLGHSTVKPPATRVQQSTNFVSRKNNEKDCVIM
ncbi:LAFA_0F12200g1_1 [Lachancea sp. 'fantastica']|nr:LAFA_0F12200g1_1 [Lachancea sp. 'fantastica']